jgi:hypothetical protein
MGISLVTMALLPLIHGSVVALFAIASLPSSSWRCCPHRNGVIIIINVIALITCWQAGIAVVDVQAYLPVLQWQILLLS